MICLLNDDICYALSYLIICYGLHFGCSYIIYNLIVIWSGQCNSPYCVLRCSWRRTAEAPSVQQLYILQRMTTFADGSSSSGSSRVARWRHSSDIIVSASTQVLQDIKPQGITVIKNVSKMFLLKATNPLFLLMEKLCISKCTHS